MPWITWDRDLAGFSPSVWFERYAKGAHVALRTSSFGSQLAAVQSGLGVALIAEPSLEHLPSDGLWLVAHRALRDVPRVAVV